MKKKIVIEGYICESLKSYLPNKMETDDMRFVAGTSSICKEQGRSCLVVCKSCRRVRLTLNYEIEEIK